MVSTKKSTPLTKAGGGGTTGQNFSVSFSDLLVLSVCRIVVLFLSARKFPEEFFLSKCHLRFLRSCSPSGLFSGYILTQGEFFVLLLPLPSIHHSTLIPPIPGGYFLIQWIPGKTSGDVGELESWRSEGAEKRGKSRAQARLMFSVNSTLLSLLRRDGAWKAKQAKKENWKKANTMSPMK